MKRLIPFIILCAFSLNINAQSIPNPKNNGQNSYVSNPDDILTANTVTNINHLCKNLEDETGVQLAVAVVDRYEPINEGAYNYAINLFNDWGIGDKRANNGILLFVAIDCHDVQLITGSGIMNILTDDLCSEIINANLTYFAEGEYSEGTMHIVSDICRFCNKDEVKKSLKNLYPANYGLWICIAAVLLLIVVFVVLKFKK